MFTSTTKPDFTLYLMYYVNCACNYLYKYFLPYPKELKIIIILLRCFKVLTCIINTEFKYVKNTSRG